MTHRGPFQPLLFCDSVTSTSLLLRAERQHLPSNAGIGAGILLRCERLQAADRQAHNTPYTKQGQRVPQLCLVPSSASEDHAIPARSGDSFLVLEAATCWVLPAVLQGSPHQVSRHRVWRKFSPFQQPFTFPQQIWFQLVKDQIDPWQHKHNCFQ